MPWMLAAVSYPRATEVNRALALLALCAPAAAQQLAVRGPEPEVVRVGDRAVVTVSVDGTRTDAVLGSLPEVEGLVLRAGPPSRARSQTIVAGRVVTTSSTSWQVAIEPRREGVFEIPPLTVRVRERTLVTRALRLEAVRELTGKEHAFVETSTARDTWFVHEPIAVRIRFGLDARFLQSNVIQMFRLRLDLPVQVQARWLDDLPGTTVLPGADPGGDRRGRLTFALNDAVADARRVEDRVLDGRTFIVLEIERTFLPESSGELVVPAPLLRFAYATRFENDVFNGRVPADGREAFVQGERRTLRIEPLPDEGRPPEFSGAVGRFSATARAEPREVRAGESLKLALRIEGQGNLGSFDPPRLDPLEGFHVYGKIEDTRAGSRTFTYDVAPLGEGVKRIPAIRFAFFDTTPPARYRTLETEPIPITVRPAAAGSRASAPAPATARGIPGEDDIFDLKPVAATPPAPSARRLAPELLLAVVLAPWLVALGFWSWLRARERDRTDPQHARARGAAAAFRARTSRPGADVAQALVEFLAARLRCPPAAVIGPDLAARLEAAGAPAELAARAAGVLDALVGERYGGGAPAGAAEAAREVVGELERSFRS